MEKKGINLGCGIDWKNDLKRNIKNYQGLEYWDGLDQHLGNAYFSSEYVFPYGNESIDWFFSSHFFEHIDENTAKQLVKESYRSLKKGGIMRTIVPDFELLHRKYLEKDYSFFDSNSSIGKVYPCWSKYGIDPTYENVILNWFSTFHFCEKGDGKFTFRGPPILGESKDYGYRLLNTMSTQEVCDILHKKVFELKEKYPKEVVTQHISFWNYEKLEEIMLSSGFSQVYVSGFEKSKEPSMRTPLFDVWAKIGEKPMNLYVEAIK